MPCGARVGDSPAHDIESRTVRGGGDRDGQTTLDGDSPIEPEDLHGDLALVVVHRHDAVELDPFGGEDGVGRKRPARIDAQCPGSSDDTDQPT